jgi:hypothetical protein
MRPTDIPPSADAMLDWLRSVAPDIRVGHEVRGGRDATVVTMSLGMTPWRAAGFNRDAVLLRATNVYRARLGLPPLGPGPKPSDIADRIISARLHGSDVEADKLEREMVGRNAGMLPSFISHRASR